MPTLLIVDDDDSFSKQLRMLFEHGSGFDVCSEARSGVEALDKIKGRPFNLALLDLSLPDMSGIDLARRLKAIVPELAIFLMASEYSLTVEMMALSIGIGAVFSKEDDLATVVANARAVCGIE